MNRMDDATLLRNYVETGSGQAFEQLVARKPIRTGAQRAIVKTRSVCQLKSRGVGALRQNSQSFFLNFRCVAASILDNDFYDD